MSQYDLLIIIIIFLVFLGMMQIYIVFASYHSANRKPEEQITEKEVEYTTTPFSHEEILDIDSHLTAIHEHTAKHGIQGSPDNLHSFLKWLYGEDYSRNWVQQYDKSFRYEEDA